MDSLKGKKLLILGGNLLSKDIVDKARELGIYTIVTDWYSTDRSPVKLLSDEYWDVSIEDYEQISKFIKDKHIDGVFTGFTDSYLLPYQKICEMNNLPCYGTKRQFELFTNKDQYKSLCRKYDVPTIPEFCPDSEGIKYPVIVKPVDGSGSRGITICYNQGQLEKALSDAHSMTKQGKVIVERYMTGKEVTVFWLFINGAYHLMAIGNRHVKNNQSGNIIPLPVGYTFPSVFLPKYRNEVEENAKRMFNSVGIKNGMMFMQCKVEDGCCYVYDIGFRLTGSLEYKLFKNAYGIDPLEMLIHYSLTGEMTNTESRIDINPSRMKPSYNVSFLCSPGIIDRFDGLDSVRKLPGVLDVVPAYNSGQVITEQMKGLLAQIALRVLGSVESKEDLYNTMEHIWKMISIVSDSGANLLLPGIERRDVEGFVI